jgi:lipopolysaccharide export LptBFGC system permease protein LptF
VNQGVGAIGIERQIPPFDSNEDAEQAITRLADVLGRDLPSDFGQVKLMTEDQLQNAQDLVRTFDRLVWLLLILAVVLAVLAVILAPTRRSGLIRVGVGVAIAVVLGWVAVDLISARLADAAGTAEGATAIAELTSTVVATMQPVTAALAIIGLGAAAAAFISLRGGWNTNPTAVEGE